VKPGDLVRFCARRLRLWPGLEESQRPWLVGLLVEYESWEKMATVFYEGNNIRVAARNVQKSGRKDYEGR